MSGFSPYLCVVHSHALLVRVVAGRRVCARWAPRVCGHVGDGAVIRLCDHCVQFACVEDGAALGIGSLGAKFAGVGDGAAVPVLLFHVMSCHIMSSHVMSCHVVSVVSRRAV